MKKTIAIFAAFVAFSLPAQAEEQKPAQFSVTGQATAHVVPDMAWITLGVVKESKSAGVVMDGLTEAMIGITKAVEAAGIGARDVQSSNINLQPRYDHKSSGPGRLVGFQGSATITVRVKDLDVLGQVLTAVTENGANQMHGLRFDVQDRSTLLEQTRQDAVKNAISRATMMAEAAGVSLGRIISMAEHGGNARPQAMAMARAEGVMMDSMPISAGEVGISSSVSMVFELVQE